jgi:hypothetical protein
MVADAANGSAPLGSASTTMKTRSFATVSKTRRASSTPTVNGLAIVPAERDRVARVDRDGDEIEDLLAAGVVSTCARAEVAIDRVGAGALLDDEAGEPAFEQGAR